LGDRAVAAKARSEICGRQHGDAGRAACFGFLLVGLAIYYGEIGQVDLSSRALGLFLAGAIGASFGKVFYYRGIDLVGASKATSVKNGSPLLTVILAVLFLGEEMSWFIVAGVTLIVVGIAVLSQAQTSPAAGAGRFEYLLFPLIAASASASTDL
jgi:drug/metabolite transporter (DMT)-like permease